MTWRLTHHFACSPCRASAPLVRGGLFRRTRQPRCPSDHGSVVAAGLRPAITELLRRRGIDYEPVGHENSFLWCLGGPELYRKPDDVEDLSQESCLDLNLNVCDEHRVVSLDLYPYDVVPAQGGAGPDDPLRSEPIELGDEPAVVPDVLARLECWLDEILILPR